MRMVDPLTQEIDWQELRARIAKTFESARQALQPSPDRIREVLEERARWLARSPDIGERPAERMEVLAFQLGREQYGLETRFAREVIRLTDFTAVPGAPDFLIGLMNLRGDILPVFDLMLFFGLASHGLMDRSRVVVVGTGNADFGIIADSVQEVSQLFVDEFVPNPVFEGKRGHECLRGVTRSAMIVLDGAALMTDQRLFIGAPGSAAP